MVRFFSYEKCEDCAKLGEREREWDSRGGAMKRVGKRLMRAGDGKEKTVVGSFPRDSKVLGPS